LIRHAPSIPSAIALPKYKKCRRPRSISFLPIRRTILAQAISRLDDLRRRGRRRMDKFSSFAAYDDFTRACHRRGR
jgi:hypothetical protein